MTDFQLLLNNTTSFVGLQSAPIETINNLGVWEAFVTMFAFFIVVVAVHELGHFFMLTHYNKEARIHVARKSWYLEIHTGENEDYWQLRPLQRYYVYSAGIIAGLVPIMVFASLHQFYMLLLAPYVIGLGSDIENIVRSIKQMNKDKAKLKTLQDAVKTV